MCYGEYTKKGNVQISLEYVFANSLGNLQKKIGSENMKDFFIPHSLVFLFPLTDAVLLGPNANSHFDGAAVGSSAAALVMY